MLYERETPIVWWDAPVGAGWDSIAMELSFSVILEKKPAQTAMASALDALCDEWGRFRERWPLLRPELEKHLLGCSRAAIAPWCSDEERSAYEDVAGRLSDEKVLSAVGRGTIAMTRAFDRPVSVELHFNAPWSEEHGIDAPFDADGRILRYD